MKIFVMLVILAVIGFGVASWNLYPKGYLVEEHRNVIGVEPIEVKERPMIFMDEVKIGGSIKQEKKIVEEEMEVKLVCSNWKKTKLDKSFVKFCEVW
jgi:hypothetical protein